MTRKRKKRNSPGRPSVKIAEARAFGRLVEQEMKSGEMQARAFDKVRRSDPRRWKSERTMFRLWKMYREDKACEPEIIQALSPYPNELAMIKSVTLKWMREGLDRMKSARPFSITYHD